MNQKTKKILLVVLALVLVGIIVWLSMDGSLTLPPVDDGDGVVRGTSYTTKEDVAEYLHLYGELPPNFITKSQAGALGWVSSEGNLWEVANGKSIGGDVFSNYEKTLPDKKGRTWYECDIDYAGGYRGAERIVFSSDGLIYYTNDHYETFERLY